MVTQKLSRKMAGVPVPMIQKQVGHKRLSTTEIYATVAPALVKEAYDLHGFRPEKGISSGYLEKSY